MSSVGGAKNLCSSKLGNLRLYGLGTAHPPPTVRDYAKIGYLFLNKGRWEDKQGDLVIVRVANQTKGSMDLVKFLTMVLSAIES